MDRDTLYICYISHLILLKELFERKFAPHCTTMSLNTNIQMPVCIVTQQIWLVHSLCPAMQIKSY